MAWDIEVIRAVLLNGNGSILDKWPPPILALVLHLHFAIRLINGFIRFIYISTGNALN